MLPPKSNLASKLLLFEHAKSDIISALSPHYGRLCTVTSQQNIPKCQPLGVAISALPDCPYLHGLGVRFFVHGADPNVYLGQRGIMISKPGLLQGGSCTVRKVPSSCRQFQEIQESFSISADPASLATCPSLIKF
jgi:hypothetical protein